MQDGDAEVALDELLRGVGCCMSRLRWQSGQGVTRQSAPASIASARWRPAWRSEVVRFIVITGKPQHLRAPAYSTGLAAERLDQLLEVVVALGVLVEAEPLATGRTM